MRLRRNGRRGVAIVVPLALVITLLTACDSTPVVLSGQVTTASSQPLGAVPVQIYSNTNQVLVASTTTEFNGTYEFRSSKLADGSYRIRVGSQWWSDAWSWGTADTVALSAAAPTTIDMMIEADNALTGVVVDDSGNPLDAVLVAVVRGADGRIAGTTTTDAAGAFDVPIAMSGTYRVVLLDTTGTWPRIDVGGGEPHQFHVGNRYSLGTIDISTGKPFDVPAGVTTRASVSSFGSQANDGSSGPSISADGGHVSFNSRATNLVPDTPQDQWRVYVRNLGTGATELVSVASDGTHADGYSAGSAISADGRIVAFQSEATNLVPGDTNDRSDIFVRDRSTGVTSRVSVASDGSQAQGPSWDVSISADGRYVAFGSDASNLVVPNPSGYQLYVHDRTTGSTELVSVASDGTPGDAPSSTPALSADGRHVAFQSQASNFADDAPIGSSIYVHDRSTGTTTLESVGSGGTPGNDGSYSETPSISADARYVAFHSDAENLVPDDTNGNSDIFVRDRVTGTTSRASVPTGGTQTDGPSWGGRISADGRYVAYESKATTLVPGDTDERDDVYVYDRLIGTTTLVSVTPAGFTANYDSVEVSISADGRRIAFTSTASDLIPLDTNNASDIFVRTRPGA